MDMVVFWPGWQICSPNPPIRLPKQLSAWLHRMSFEEKREFVFGKEYETTCRSLGRHFDP